MAGGPDVLTVISNAAFVLPAVEAARRRYWWRFCIYLLVLVSSSLYHTCNSFHGACAGLPPHVPREMDFFFAQLLIPLTALYIIWFPPDPLYWAEPVLIVASAFGIFLAEQYWESSLTMQLVLSGISFFLILLYWIIYGTVYRELPRYHWDKFGLAIGLTALSTTLFVVEMMNPPFYWAIHSVWHVNAALAQYFLLLIWPKRPDEMISTRYVALAEAAGKKRHLHRPRTRDRGWRT